MNTTYAIKSQQSLVFQIVFGVVGLSVASQINIPIYPVPINLGTLAVMLIGLHYSFPAAIYSATSYILLGILGVPIFNHFSSGVFYFFGPTCGYLLGYVVAAAVMSYLREKYIYQGRLIDTIFLCIIGQICIYSLGISWLSYLKDLDFAIRFGLLPFIIPGMVKTIILSSLVTIIRR